MSDGDDMVRDVLSRAPGHPLRVAIDGVTASGKTTCAQWLVDAVAAQGRPSVHVTMDGFHHRRAHRYRQGRASALGYYRDAYDFDAFVSHVLIPLGPNGSCAIRRRVIDLAADEPVDDPLGGPEAAGRAFDQRYHAACRIYLDEVDPRARATRVLPVDWIAIG
jgi:uridine kinase